MRGIQDCYELGEHAQCVHCARSMQLMLRKLSKLRSAARASDKYADGIKFLPSSPPEVYDNDE